MHYVAGESIGEKKSKRGKLSECYQIESKYSQNKYIYGELEFQATTTSF